MEGFEELQREAEEVKERVRRDIFEFRDILRRLADQAAEEGKVRAEVAMHRAEKRIEETANRVENRIEKAIATMSGQWANYGKTVSRELDFSDFTNVEVCCAFNVEITRSDSYHVSVTAGERLCDHLDVTKSGHTLKIALNPLPFHARPTLEARITMPTINKLRLAGAAKGKANGFNSQECFDLNLSGASCLDVDMEAGYAKFEISGASRLRGRMKLADAEFVLSGASQAKLSGSANNVSLSAWGASNLDLVDFILNDTSVNLKGASQAVVTVNGRLDLELSGGSRLCYSGTPTMGKINVSGASCLSHR